VPELPDFDLTPFRRKTPDACRPPHMRAKDFSAASCMAIRDPIPYHKFMFCVAGPVGYIKTIGKDLFFDILQPAHQSKNLVFTLSKLCADVPFGFLVKEEVQAQFDKLLGMLKAKERVLRRFRAYCGSC